MGISDRFKELKHAWNVFKSLETTQRMRNYEGYASYGSRPDRSRLSYSNERSILASILTRLGIDIALMDFRHVRLDDNERYLEDIDSDLNNCLKLEANMDQGSRHFIQDIATTMFDKGCVAIVPIDTTEDPTVTGAYDIRSMRVAEITGWHPYHVRVSVYNERKGQREEVTVEKRQVAIVENPMYAVMNEPNSTLQRLIRKLNMLDAVDEASSSGKLDLIIQLPYVVKTDSRKAQAEQRRTDLEYQLKGSKYGIAYTDGTEKITQLNRPAENNLLKQIEYLTNLLYSQLGLTPTVMDGTADEAAMLNYYNRTINPMVEAILQAMKRSFLTKTARSQKQSIVAFRDPFKLVPMTTLADIADKLIRNQVASSNDMRQVIGWKPSKDPQADKLQNPNMPMPETAADPAAAMAAGEDPEGDDAVQSAITDVTSMLDDLLSELGVDANALA